VTGLPWEALRRPGSIALRALAVAAVPAAVVLVVLATDVLRSPEELASDDRRFQTAPLRQAGLWDVGLLPRDASEKLLGLTDDVGYRELAGLYLKVEPGKIEYQGFPERESLRAKAQFELTRLSREESDAERQSRLLTMYGVMTLDSRPLGQAEYEDMLRRAASAFRNAIDLDPSNTDAKTNLEAVLSVFGPLVAAGENPTGGANRGNVSGQGGTGTGY
jgi:hypothetical protein